MAEIEVISERTMLERAARALGKIDHWGPRGLTMITTQELEAMALTLVALGLVAVAPGQAMPARLVVGGCDVQQ